MRRKTQLLAEDVLFVQLISYLGISAATSVSNLRQGGISASHTAVSVLFYSQSQWAWTMEIHTVFVFSHSACEAFVFVFPASPPGCIFMCALPRETVTAQIPASVLCLNGHVCLRKMWVARVCVHVRAYATLHVLWSLLSFLPLMLFPVVSKLPHWCTILSHALFANKDLRFSAYNLVGLKG